MTKDQINKIIHEKLFGLCWHKPETHFSKPHYCNDNLSMMGIDVKLICSKCGKVIMSYYDENDMKDAKDAEKNMLKRFSNPDYTTDAMFLPLKRKVMEQVWGWDFCVNHNRYSSGTLLNIIYIEQPTFAEHVAEWLRKKGEK